MMHLSVHPCIHHTSIHNQKFHFKMIRVGALEMHASLKARLIQTADMCGNSIDNTPGTA